MPETRHPKCPVCTGTGGWTPTTGSPSQRAAFADWTVCVYCKGSGRCPTCALERVHDGKSY